MPGVYELPFWCGEDRPTGPNTDIPAKPFQTEELGSAASLELEGRQLSRKAHVWECRFAASLFGSELFGL